MSWSHVNQFIEHVYRCEKPLYAWINRYDTLCWGYSYPAGDFHMNVGCYQRDGFDKTSFLEDLEHTVNNIEEYV